MSFIEKIQLLIGSDSRAAKVAKKLPAAYIASIGQKNMDIEDPDSEGDWLGLGDPLPKAQVTDFISETGSFTFRHIVVKDNDDIDRYSTAMKISEVESGFIIQAGNDSVIVPVNPDETSLLPVIKMALSHAIRIS